MLLLFNTVYVEIKQMINETKCINYFKSLFNWIEMSSLLVCLIIVITTLIEEYWITKKTLRILAAIDSCVMLMTSYFWLRLFEGTAFYIRLI